MRQASRRDSRRLAMCPELAEHAATMDLPAFHPGFLRTTGTLLRMIAEAQRVYDRCARELAGRDHAWRDEVRAAGSRLAMLRGSDG